MLNYVLDENIQVHGGNGYVRDYPAERHYRDSRVNRIFEGHQRDQPPAHSRHPRPPAPAKANIGLIPGRQGAPGRADGTAVPAVAQQDGPAGRRATARWESFKKAAVMGLGLAMQTLSRQARGSAGGVDASRRYADRHLRGRERRLRASASGNALQIDGRPCVCQRTPA
jgi:hypothetical protein